MGEPSVCLSVVRRQAARSREGTAARASGAAVRRHGGAEAVGELRGGAAVQGERRGGARRAACDIVTQTNHM
jgi:hypothetical protein